MPDFISTSPKNLGKSVEEWPQSILAEISDWGGLPPESKLSLEFHEKKLEEGTAVGTVVMNIAGKPINVPVVITDHRLLPMDVMEVGGEYAPLTKKRLTEAFTSGGQFSGTVHPSEVTDYGQNISQLVRPPSTYRGGMGKLASLMDAEGVIPHVTLTARRPAYQELLLPIDDALIENYKLTGTHDVLMGMLRKVTGEQVVTESKGGEIKPRDPAGDYSIVWVPRPTQQDIAKGWVTILGASGRGFDPAMMDLPVREATEFYSNPEAIDPMSTSAILVNNKRYAGKQIGGVIGEGLRGSFDGIKELNLGQLGLVKADILGADGQLHEATTMIPRLVNLFAGGDKDMAGAVCDGKLIIGKRLFGRITGGAPDGLDRKRREQAPVLPWITPEAPPMIVMHCDDGCCPSFGPFEAVGRSTSPVTVGDKTFTVSSLDVVYGPNKGRISISDLFSTPIVSGNDVKLPAHFRHIVVHGGVMDSPDSPAAVGYLAKVAHQKRADWLRAFSNDKGVTVSLDMPVMVKSAYEAVLSANGIADSLNQLNPKIAQFIVTAAGVNPKDAENVVKTAQEEPVTVWGVDYLPVPAAKTAAATEHRYSEMNELRRKYARLLWVNMVKEAAEIGDKKTVDAILGLGLVDESNVDEYMEAIPVYREVVQGLAKMLSRARVTDSPVSEEVLRKAMSAIEGFLEQAEAYLSAKRILEAPQGV